MSSTSDPALHDTVASAPGVLISGPGGPAQEAPTLIGGRYEVLGLLGSGAMGSVYRVRDIELDQVVALKMLRRDLLQLPEMVERFRQEVKLARMVTHRNVARTFDIGEHDGERFLTMEFIEGEPLSARLRGKGPLASGEVVGLIKELCAGLQAAHEAGVVHRDLKPDNVMLCRDGRIVVTDFGIARGVYGGPEGGESGSSEGLVGTPAYMAPEQVQERPDIDQRADIYAIGCLLYELLTGELPWQGRSAHVVLLLRLNNPPPDPRARRPDLPESLAKIVLRCLARDPEGRFASAGDLGQALDACATACSAVPAPQAQAAEPRAAPTVLSKTVAVLPFRNAGAPEDEYLADGFSADIIDSLSAVRGLRVRSRGAVLAHRGSDRDPRELGRELGVQVVVEGSIRKLVGSLRIQARVVGVADGFQLWARRFDRPAADVLAVSDEVAQAIAAALTVDMAPSTREAPKDPRIPDLHLRARHLYHKVELPEIMRSVALFEEALSLDPHDPALLVGCALARARLWFFGGAGSGERARDAAQRAIQAAPSRGEPRLALAVVKFQSGDMAGAVRELRLAIERAPALADAYELLGRILIETGPLQEGINHLTMAISLDPELHQGAVSLARAHALLGNHEQADRCLDAIRSEGGQFVKWLIRSRLLLWRRDTLRARMYLRDPDIAAGKYPLPRAFLDFVVHSRTGADLITYYDTRRNAAGSERSRAVYQQLRCETAICCGEMDLAASMLEQSVASGLMDLMWLDLCPLLVALRQGPRFSLLREQVAERALHVRDALR